VGILMGKSQGFHAILTGFPWRNSWGFHGENPMKKGWKFP